MARLAATAVRDTFGDTLNRVAYGGERIVLERHGKAVAALVSVADLARLEALEDQDDAQAARKGRRDRGRVPYEEVRRKAGLAGADAATLKRIVTELRRWDPERIVLFGSHARGDAGPDSDLDILVVLPDGQPATRAAVIDMRVAIGSVPIDYDLLITTHSEYEWRRDCVGAIEHPASREGIELYAA
ncbi:MAG: type II toxin-antitoxin system prevent-host-death family antitoxin [Acidobacteria bacterium]|nr:type II toxin-antitoxin system prevent-host-death family antitoxin [Acidobacteriota bacterium]